MPRIEGTLLRAPDGTETHVPQVVVRVHVNGLAADLPAIVDSGADVTILPAEFLEPFGVVFDVLPPATDGIGAGGTFRIASCGATVRFREWLVTERISVAEPGHLQVALLGRGDFFRAFTVRFQWHRDPPFFDVDPVVKK